MTELDAGHRPLPLCQTLLILAGSAPSPRPSSARAPAPERPATTVSERPTTVTHVLAFALAGGCQGALLYMIAVLRLPHRLTRRARRQLTNRPFFRPDIGQVSAAARRCRTVPVVAKVSRWLPRLLSVGCFLWGFGRTIVCHSRGPMPRLLLGSCIVTWCPELAAGARPTCGKKVSRSSRDVGPPV